MNVIMKKKGGANECRYLLSSIVASSQVTQHRLFGRSGYVIDIGHATFLLCRTPILCSRPTHPLFAFANGKKSTFDS